MSRDKFRVVASAIITKNGDILIGRKKEKKDHPVSEQWVLPGGHLDKGEKIEEAVVREVEEETSLESKVHQLVDSYQKSYNSDRSSMVRMIYHCEASSREAEAEDDLQDVKWVSPENLGKELGSADSEVIKRPRISNFIEKVEKMPAL